MAQWPPLNAPLYVSCMELCDVFGFPTRLKSLSFNVSGLVKSNIELPAACSLYSFVFVESGVAVIVKGVMLRK